MNPSGISLIVNADDFGLSGGVNRGIIAAHERGIVSSASLMVRQAAAAEAAGLSRLHPGLSVGLHLDLGEWAPTKDGQWSPLYVVVDTRDRDAVRREIANQLHLFRQLMGRDPTHMDSHQHVHREEPVTSELLRAAGDLRVPVRHYHHGIHYCGHFYGQGAHGMAYPQGITPAALRTILSALPPGTTELSCHPSADNALESPYRDERVQELSTLTDPATLSAIADVRISLRSFQPTSSEGKPSSGMLFWPLQQPQVDSSPDEP